MNHCIMDSCKKSIYTSIRVKTQHFPKYKITWQTWDMCQGCFETFLAKKGIGYYRKYRDGHITVVVGFRLELLAYPFEFDQEFVPLDLDQIAQLLPNF